MIVIIIRSFMTIKGSWNVLLLLVVVVWLCVCARHPIVVGDKQVVFLVSFKSIPFPRSPRFPVCLCEKILHPGTNFHGKRTWEGKGRDTGKRVWKSVSCKSILFLTSFCASPSCFSFSNSFLPVLRWTMRSGKGKLLIWIIFSNQ